MTCALTEDSDQPVHLHSLIWVRVFRYPYEEDSDHWLLKSALCFEYALRSHAMLLVLSCSGSLMSQFCFLQLCCIWAATWQNQQSECAPSEDSDQLGHPPSLIRVFAIRMKKPWVLSYPMSAQRRLWSDWADAQADLSLPWGQSHFVSFVMSWLILLFTVLLAPFQFCLIFLCFCEHYYWN